MLKISEIGENAFNECWQYTIWGYQLILGQNIEDENLV